MRLLLWWACATGFVIGLGAMARDSDAYVALALNSARDVGVMWQGTIIWTWMCRK